MKTLGFIQLLLAASLIVLFQQFQSDDVEYKRQPVRYIISTPDTTHSAENKGDMTSLAMFPTVRGANLEGQDFVLPDDFGGILNLVFVVFQRHQQTMVNTWLPLAQTLSKRHPWVRYYELPTIDGLNPVFQWYINRGMRAGIQDSIARATTITLYLDKPMFRKVLDLPNEDTIYVFLIDDKGWVIWRTEGVQAKEVYEKLQDVIKLYNNAPNLMYKKTITL